MITIEASKDKKVVDSLCLTDPYDGGSRERNNERRIAWERKIEEAHGEVVYAVYFD